MRCYLIGLPLCSLFLAPFNPDALPRVQPASDPKPVVAPVAADPKALPTNDEMKQLAEKDPIAFFEACLRRYQRDVKGYTLTFEKHERTKGTLHPKEIINVSFREEPYSVHFKWQEGARKAQTALYVEGENDGQLLIRPVGKILGRLVVSRDPEGDEAKESGRYSLKEFGLKKGTERVLKTWKAARDQGGLFVEFLGEQKVKEVGDRPCWVLKRSRFLKPESDGVLEVTVYIDKETWLQVGSLVKGKDGEQIGTYYFRDIKLNPEFKAEQFKKDAL